jgi:hypothetical protein
VEYADLEVRILKKDTNGYPVEITFNGELEFPRGVLSPVLPVLTAGVASGQDGVMLFQWLFSDDALKTAWANARGQRPQRRIRLRIDEGAPELHQIPWEILRDIGEGGVPLDLAALEATPFSRYIAGSWVPGSPILKRPIRVLAAVANPTNLASFGLSEIDPDVEFKLLQGAVAGNSKIEFVKLEGPCTLQSMDAALRKGFHVLHFIGHGKYVDGTSVLFLCNPEDNRAVPVKDTDIAAMLGRQLADAGSHSDDKLRLVYLSSCQTATRSPADAFRGLAPGLIAAGVPAVLAMQDVVPIKTATEFSKTFYTAQLDHGQVDRASNAARASVMSAGLPGAAFPVLFMRLRSGQLFGNAGKILGPLQESAWKTLLDNIKRKNCTPILGPGVTLGLLPQPDEIAAELASGSVYPFPDANDFLRVSQVIGTIDDTSLREQVLGILVAGFRKRIGLAADGLDLNLSATIDQVDWINLGPRLFETECHRQLAALGLPLYVTTNFDNFMAMALEARLGKRARRETISWRTPPSERYDLDLPPAADDPVVMHLFGTDEDMQSMVLTEDDHLDYLANISHDHDNFLPFSVNDRLASTTLLFLGYRLEDLNLKVILRGLLTHLDLGKWNRLQLAVQLESAKQDEAGEKEVIDYLERSIQQYFPRKAPVQIYWGSAQQFMADLTARWERFGK